jgi:hypothetical protein
MFPHFLPIGKRFVMRKGEKESSSLLPETHDHNAHFVFIFAGDDFHIQWNFFSVKWKKNENEVAMRRVMCSYYVWCRKSLCYGTETHLRDKEIRFFLHFYFYSFLCLPRTWNILEERSNWKKSVVKSIRKCRLH